LYYHSHIPLPHLPSIPTRRSSDLSSPAPTRPRRGDSDHHRMQTGPDDCETIVSTRCPSACTDGTLSKPHSATQTGHFAYPAPTEDRKSTRLNSSHVKISYAVFCLK